MSLREVLSKAHGVAVPPPLDRDQIFPDYYTPRHWQWMGRPESERRWSAEALEHNRLALTGHYARLAPRKGRLSPSSIGTDCERELLFAYAQAPQEGVSPKQAEVMESGTFEHIRMQMVGLTAGYLSRVEVFVHATEIRCGGSIDGIGDDRSLWELKNTESHLFDPITKGPEFLAAAVARERRGEGSAAAYAAHMVTKHKLQMEAYWYADELQAEAESREPLLSDFGSLVYRRKGSGRLYELRIRKERSRRRAVQAIIDSANGWIDLDTLPDRLEGCEAIITGNGAAVDDKARRRHDGCFYRDHCATAGNVLSRC